MTSSGIMSRLIRNAKRPSNVALGESKMTENQHETQRTPTCQDGAIRFCPDHPETIYTLAASPGSCGVDGKPLICDHIQFGEDCQ